MAEVNVFAPIIPGRSAADICIGSVFSLAVSSNDLTCTRYELGCVTVFVADGRVSQIGVTSGYRGALNQVIHIGSTIAEVEAVFGIAVVEDDEDNLIVPNSPGWCFETEQWREGHEIRNNVNARISGIYIFAAE